MDIKILLFLFLAKWHVCKCEIENIRHPQNCQSLKYFGLPDGEYCLTQNVSNNVADSKEASIYCHNMKTNPQEYLTLPSGYTDNYSKYSQGSNSGELKFNKIRILFRSKITVDVRDFTFADIVVISGKLDPIIGWSVGLDCRGCSVGQPMSVSLAGTPFTFFDVKQVYASGYAPCVLSKSISSQAVTATCGGSCGYCFLEDRHYGSYNETYLKFDPLQTENSCNSTALVVRSLLGIFRNVSMMVDMDMHSYAIVVADTISSVLCGMLGQSILVVETEDNDYRWLYFAIHFGGNIIQTTTIDIYTTNDPIRYCDHRKDLQLYTSLLLCGRKNCLDVNSELNMIRCTFLCEKRKQVVIAMQNREEMYLYDMYYVGHNDAPET